MAVTYTIAEADGNPGSIVVTPSIVTNSAFPQYYLNVKNVKLIGSNPFLADGVTLSPQASFSLFCLQENTWLIKNLLMSSITSIGGSPTPATLALTMAAIAALIAEAGGGSGGGLPDQTGEAGNILTTDGTDASWAQPTAFVETGLSEINGAANQGTALTQTWDLDIAWSLGLPGLAGVQGNVAALDPIPDYTITKGSGVGSGFSVFSVNANQRNLIVKIVTTGSSEANAILGIITPNFLPNDPAGINSPNCFLPIISPANAAAALAQGSTQCIWASSSADDGSGSGTADVTGLDSIVLMSGSVALTAGTYYFNLFI